MSILDLPQEIRQLLSLPNIIRVPAHHDKIRNGWDRLSPDIQQQYIERARGFLTEQGALAPGKEPIEVLTTVKHIADAIPS